jgi:enolase-phosphatase E1
MNDSREPPMRRIILTDIEGTTSSISFVKNVLFPYARAELPRYVREHSDDPKVRRWLEQVQLEIGDENADDDTLVATLVDWIDADRKHTALKALQGMLWKDGYENGNYTAHVYDDAVQALRDWHADGRLLYVYSSGSVPAQRLLFGHSTAGDLTPLFSGYFDTDVGGKREARSYRNILDQLGADADDVLFLSDVVEELDAARDVGIATVLIDRVDDYASPRTGEATHGHARATSFADVAG